MSHLWQLLATKAYAQKFELGLPLSNNPDGNSFNSFGEYFTRLLGIAVDVAAVVAVLIIVYAGFMYSRSQGQPQPIAHAKELVAGALTGLAILLMIRLITPTLGITVR